MRSLRHDGAPISPPIRPPPLSGESATRVRYCECDPMGVAHHGAYAAWLEEARTAILRESGVSYAAMERAGVFLVVTRLDIRFRRPALYDDILAIRCRVARSTRVKIEHEDDIRVTERHGAAETTGAPIAEAATTLACVDADGRPRALPEWLARTGGDGR